ncbi:hypothetical protein J6Y50_06810 [bacterium]|nr:hypothetical protein [bacterium]
MKSLRFFTFLFLTVFSCANLLAAPKTLDEINEEREKQEIEKKIAKENEKKAVEENCQNNSSVDCVTYAQRFAQNDEEKLVYFGKACELQYQPGCDEANKIKAAIEAEKARIAAEEKRKAEAEQERLRKEAEAEKERQRKEAEAENERQQLETKKAATYHPYKTAGISLIVAGALVTAAGVAGFHIASDKEYDNYKKMGELDTAKEKASGLTKEEYINKANNYRNKSNTYRILEISSGAFGGALLVTGVVLTAIKKEKHDKKVSLTNLSVIPANDGFYAALGFEF